MVKEKLLQRDRYCETKKIRIILQKCVMDKRLSNKSDDSDKGLVR